MNIKNVVPCRYCSNLGCNKSELIARGNSILKIGDTNNVILTKINIQCTDYYLQFYPGARYRLELKSKINEAYNMFTSCYFLRWYDRKGLFISADIDGPFKFMIYPKNLNANKNKYNFILEINNKHLGYGLDTYKKEKEARYIDNIMRYYEPMMEVINENSK